MSTFQSHRFVKREKTTSIFWGNFFISINFSIVSIWFPRFIGQTKGNLVLIMSIPVFAHMRFTHFPDWMLPPIPSNQWVRNTFLYSLILQTMLSKYELLRNRFFVFVFFSLDLNAFAFFFWIRNTHRCVTHDRQKIRQTALNLQVIHKQQCIIM